MNKVKASALICSLVWIAGSAGAVAEDDWGMNLLTNADFLDGDMVPTDWTIRVGAQQKGEAVFSEVALDNVVVRGSGRSLRITGNSKTTRWYAVESAPIKVSPGQRYRFSGYIETENVNCEPEQFANCNLYVMFADERNRVVRVGQNQVAATEQLFGSNAWKSVETIVPAPPRAVVARLGLVLTCSGTAWFDDVSFQAYGDINWSKKQSDRFAFFFDGNDAPTPSDVMGLEAHLASLEKSLRLEWPKKITYYKYPNLERKRKITGRASAAHFESDGIHAVFYQDRHEIVHVLMQLVGASSPFFAEGIAVHLAGDWDRRDVDDVARDFANEGRLVSVQQLLERGAFFKQPAEVVFPHAGSFVRFLIKKYGVDHFKRFYPLETAYEDYWEQLSRFQSVYGKSLETVEEEWLNALGL